VPVFSVLSPNYDDITGEVTLKFNQALVEEGKSIEDVKWRPSISPNNAGNWTLTDSFEMKFTPTSPWTKATKYTVKVAAGIQSIQKEKLQKEYQYEFTTPTPLMIDKWPVSRYIAFYRNRRAINYDIHLQRSIPLICIVFNQPINVDAQLKNIKVCYTDKGKIVKNHPIRKATETEIDDNPSIHKP
jgi:hypothetical protein